MTNDQKNDDGFGLQLYTHILAAISHDIRTPLYFISLSANDAMQQLETGHYEGVERTVEMIAYTTDRMASLVENLLAFLRTRLYGEQIRLAPVDLGRLVSDKGRLFKAMAEMQESVMLTEIPSGVIAHTDEGLLGIIMHNLLDNALKVSRKGQVIIRAKQERGKAIVIVSDQGPGMPSAIIDWLCNDSGAVIPPSLPKGNSGLGLTIVKELSRLLGARIFVKNNAGAHVFLELDDAT